jgi:hypothetical protein
VWIDFKTVKEKAVIVIGANQKAELAARWLESSIDEHYPIAFYSNSEYAKGSFIYDLPVLNSKEHWILSPEYVPSSETVGLVILESFDFDCDDCIDVNDVCLDDFDNDADDGWDDEWFPVFEGEILDESVKKKFVIRNGKKVIKFVTNKPNTRIEMQNGRPKEIRMMPQEKLKRKRAQKRAQIKRKSKLGKMQLKRKKSIKKRKMMGLPSMFNNVGRIAK